jgi:menaquinone-dependent protoporphyrinogen oxidase
VARILIPVWSEYGHTRKICERIGAGLTGLGHTYDIARIQEGPDPAGYDAVLVAASIRHGKHDPSVLEYVSRQLAQLRVKPSAFLSVSLIARKPTRNTPDSNPYVRAFIARSPWKPALVGVFGGELDYQRYGLFNRYAIRLIMKINRGPTDLHTKVAFTDWDEVDRFAGRFAALLGDRAG